MIGMTYKMTKTRDKDKAKALGAMKLTIPDILRNSNRDTEGK